jgi:outer membrane protein assembly factor BamE (lipoprotein component of BamABCDE complex)
MHFHTSFVSLAAMLIGAALAICLTSCANSITTGTMQLSRGLVDQSLINGKTTKAQVIALLGEPQSTVSSSTAGAMAAFMPAETWTYSKTFYRDAAEKGFGRAVALAMVNPYGSGYDRVEVSVLMITFDSKGRVTGHTFSTSAAGAKQ